MAITIYSPARSYVINSPAQEKALTTVNLLANWVDEAGNQIVDEAGNHIIFKTADTFNATVVRGQARSFVIISPAR